MSRKQILPSFKILDAVDISTSQTSGKTSIEGIDNVALQAVWNGTSPVGVLYVEVSVEANPVNWDALDFGSAISISGNTGMHTININQHAFKWLRVRYVRTSGTGTMTVTELGKTVGA